MQVSISIFIASILHCPKTNQNYSNHPPPPTYTLLILSKNEKTLFFLFYWEWWNPAASLLFWELAFLLLNHNLDKKNTKKPLTYWSNTFPFTQLERGGFFFWGGDTKYLLLHLQCKTQQNHCQFIFKFMLILRQVQQIKKNKKQYNWTTSESEVTNDNIFHKRTNAMFQDRVNIEEAFFLSNCHHLLGYI